MRKQFPTKSTVQICQFQTDTPCTYPVLTILFCLVDGVIGKWLVSSCNGEGHALAALLPASVSRSRWMTEGCCYWCGGTASASVLGMLPNENGRQGARWQQHPPNGKCTGGVAGLHHLVLAPNVAQVRSAVTVVDGKSGRQVPCVLCGRRQEVHSLG